jgi:hypothetical protein
MSNFIGILFCILLPILIAKGASQTEEDFKFFLILLYGFELLLLVLYYAFK